MSCPTNGKPSSSICRKKRKSVNAFIATSAEGLNIVPARDGKPLQAQEFAALSDEEKAAWKEHLSRLAA